MDPRPVSAPRSTLVRWMGVMDANVAGFVHGGTVLRLVDEVAALAGIGVRVETEDPLSGERRHTNSAYLTMVALDGHGRPAEVPGLRAETPEDVRREREAQVRRRNRLAERDEILAARDEP